MEMVRGVDILFERQLRSTGPSPKSSPLRSYTQDPYWKFSLRFAKELCSVCGWWRVLIEIFSVLVSYKISLGNAYLVVLLSL